MTKERARDELRGHLEEYLTEFHGVQNTRRNFRCLNPDHEDRNPSMGFDTVHNRVRCFSCGFSADIVDLIKLDRGMSDREAFDWGYAHYRIDGGGTVTSSPYRPQMGEQAQKVEAKGQDFSAYLAECAARLEGSPGMEYLQRRGLNAEVIGRFGIGYDPAFSRGTGPSTWRAVIIPTGADSFVARNVDVGADDEARKRERVRKCGPSRPFHLEALSGDVPVLVVEGELDALSVMECGGEAVGLGSTANVDALLRYLDGNGIRPRYPFQIALDNDDEGREAARKLGEGLGKRGIPFMTVNVAEGHKDPNAALMADRAAFAASVQTVIADVEARGDISSLPALQDDGAAEPEAMTEEARQRYFDTSVAAHLPDFIQTIMNNRNAVCYPTGFAELDDLLNGGFRPALYIMGAVSSLGKTSFALQLADNVAAGGADVLFYSLEMSRDELIAKSLSRLTYQITTERGWTGWAKTTAGILAGSPLTGDRDGETEVLEAALRDYTRYAGHVFIREGGDILGAEQVRAGTAEHIAATGRKPFVVVDYLQILTPEDARATDKQNADRAVTALKHISRDFDVPVLAISSFNRENYNTPVSMSSFKESGGIEFSSDILLALQYSFMAYQDGEDERGRSKRIRAEQAKQDELAANGKPQRIEARILKNRNGRKGRVLLDFTAKYNHYAPAKRTEGRFYDLTGGGS